MINTLQTGADTLDARRSQRRGREPPRPADPAAAFDHRPVARLAGRPGRAAPVPVIATALAARKGGGPEPRRLRFTPRQPASPSISGTRSQSWRSRSNSSPTNAS